MNTRGNDKLRNALAAEYVLGTLRGAARRRFEAWLREDRDLARVVSQWQAHFAPLDELIPAISPPTRVWDGVVARLPVLAPSAPAASGWLQSLAFWKGLAGALGAVALFALALPLLRSPVTAPVAPGAYVATISDDKTHLPVAVMMMPEQGNEVVLQLVADGPPVPRDQVLQLWMANPGGTGVVSAGLATPPNGTQSVRFAVPDPAHLRGSSILGLSLEPPGGSPSATHLLGFGKWTKLSS